MIQPGIVVIVVAIAIAVVGGGGSSTNEGCTSSVPGFPLEVIQEQLRKASGSQAGTSSKVPPSSPLDEAEITIYSCAIDIPSKTDEQRFNNLRTWYQVQDELNPRLSSVENGAATLTSE